MLKKITLVLALVLSMSALLVNCGLSNPFVTSAKIYLQNSDYSNAKKKLEEALKNNPKLEEAAFLLGLCYIGEDIKDDNKDGKYDNMSDADFLKMKENFDIAMAAGVTYKSDIEAHVNRSFATVYTDGATEYNAGIKQMDTELTDKAKASFIKAKKKMEIALALKPAEMSVVKLLANTNLQLEDYESAKKLFNDALIKDGNDVTALNYLAIIATKEKQEDKALEYYNKIIKLAAPNPAAKDAEREMKVFKNAQKDAAVKIAAYHDKKDEFDKAAPMYEKLLTDEPSNITVLYNQGIMFGKQKKYDKAVENFSKIITLDTADKEEYRMDNRVTLADFYYAKEDYQKVIDFLVPLYSTLTGDYLIRSNELLFSSYMKLGKGTEAKKYFNK